MTAQGHTRPLPPIATLIAAGLVILGLLLDTFVAQGLLVVAGLGAFGPGILRELGFLPGQDEFQRRTAYRAGFHAYLAGGSASVLIVSGLRWGEPNSDVPTEWIVLILLLLWISWLFSALLAYWGAQKTATRVLSVFGSFWAVFFLAHVVEALKGTEPLQLIGVIVGLVLVGPYFILAWTAQRWPRATGGVLLAVSVLFAVIFGPAWWGDSLPLPTVLVTATLLLLPLVACGLALLREKPDDEDDWAPVRPA